MGGYAMQGYAQWPGYGYQQGYAAWPGYGQPMGGGMASGLSREEQITAFVQKWNLNKDSQHKLNSIPIEAQDVVMQQFSPPAARRRTASSSCSRIVSASELGGRVAIRVATRGRGRASALRPTSG